VPILNALLPIIRAWRLKNPLSLVFPNERGAMQGESARVFQEVLQRVLDRAGFPRRKVGTKERHYIVFHDTRHTFASHWVMDGGDLFRLQKILGHQSVKEQITTARGYKNLKSTASTWPSSTTSRSPANGLIE
jgi:integrase